MRPRSSPGLSEIEMGAEICEVPAGNNCRRDRLVVPDALPKAFDKCVMASAISPDAGAFHSFGGASIQ